MVLPVSLGSTAIVMLLNGALWAPALARVLDQSLRYTVDKTTREILFLPLPSDVKLKAKSFVDVTVDRAAKAMGALLLLVLVQPWGLNLDWQRLSYASLVVTVVWVFMSIRARRGYLSAFRQSIERRDVVPAEVRLSGGDLSTIETLVQELAQPDPTRVVYAIDMLESLDKRNLVTPLLLYHESPVVRQRALRALGAVRSDIGMRWLPQVRRMLSDADAGVRAAAIIAHRRDQQRGCDDPVPAAAGRSGSAHPRDRGRGARRQRVARGRGCRGGHAHRDRRRFARLGAHRPARRGGRGPPHREPALPAAVDPDALRPRSRGRGRGDGERAGGRRVGLRVRADAHRAAPEPAAEGARPPGAGRATASRWSPRSPISCATRKRTSGSAATSPRRSRRSRRSSRSTSSSRRCRSRTASCATRSSPRSTACAAPTAR